MALIFLGGEATKFLNIAPFLHKCYNRTRENTAPGNGDVINTCERVHVPRVIN